MDATSGKPLAGDAHLAQSIGIILSTPIGGRVMRREFGSALFALIDAAGNALGRLRLYAAVADALRRWEPRLRLTRVGLSAGAADGTFTIQVEGVRTDVPDTTGLTRLSIPLRPLTA